MTPMEIALDDYKRMSDFDDEPTQFDDEEPTDPRIVVPDLLRYGW